MSGGLVEYHATLKLFFIIIKDTGFYFAFINTGRPMSGGLVEYHATLKSAGLCKMAQMGGRGLDSGTDFYWYRILYWYRKTKNLFCRPYLRKMKILYERALFSANMLV
jgi:hypothetical protein